MEIVYKKLSDLKQYKNNPRNNDNAVDAVAASISEFGFKVPIIIDKENVIVAGHTRYKAAEKLGIEELPVIIADDLTPEQINAFRLADNKTAELANWDFTLLEKELNDLKELDIDMSDFGFTDEDFNIEPKEVEEDDFNVEAEVESITEAIAGGGANLQIR